MSHHFPCALVAGAAKLGGGEEGEGWEHRSGF